MEKYITNDGEVWGYEEERDARNDEIAGLELQEQEYYRQQQEHYQLIK